MIDVWYLLHLEDQSTDENEDSKSPAQNGLLENLFTIYLYPDTHPKVRLKMMDWIIGREKLKGTQSSCCMNIGRFIQWNLQWEALAETKNKIIWNVIEGMCLIS